jgi:hypothetical protein
MESLTLFDCINEHFPRPKSNRGFNPSTFIASLILMHHEGGFHLDDVRHLNDNEGFNHILCINKHPQATTLGDWLRRIGSEPDDAQDAWVKVNQSVLQPALHHCKDVTLDIDATEVVANKAGAQWTYNRNKGVMPMVGHIAETGEIAAVDFREGNVSPAKENLEFIKQCQQSLPKGYKVNALRIDAAGYQAKIVKYCDKHKINYAIRAKKAPRCEHSLTQYENATGNRYVIKKQGGSRPRNRPNKLPHW